MLLLRLGRLLVLALALMLASAALASAQSRGHKRVCSAAAPRHARCLAEVVTQDTTSTKPLVTPAPAGYGPADLWSAYNLSQSAGTPPAGGAGQTIAIVDAYDNPKAEQDLAYYRSTYGLPACTSAVPRDGGTPCFRKVNQSGGSSSYPAPDTGWAEEISLDVDMASAICPNCHILLVEASSNYMTDLGAAVNTAANMGATQISNSYGGSEYRGETADETAYYRHQGIAVTVSSGDSGYGAEFPASSQYVTAVGGTRLVKLQSPDPSTGRLWSETAWSGAGSGCSAYIAKPGWQTDTGCRQNRTVADVSAVADPNTGVAVYDTYGDPGWLVFGGTSVSSPLYAGVDALAGGRAKTPPSSYGFGSFPYDHQSSFFDISGGSNGSCGAFGYLCTAVKDYDGPTGWGTPNGSTNSSSPPPPPPPPPTLLTISSLTLHPSSVLGGSQSSTATVTLSGAAPTGGATVTLSSNQPAAAVPPSVAVRAGATSATFTVTATPVSGTRYATITATYNSSAKSTVLTIRSPDPKGGKKSCNRDPNAARRCG